MAVMSRKELLAIRKAAQKANPALKHPAGKDTTGKPASRRPAAKSRKQEGTTRPGRHLLKADGSSEDARFLVEFSIPILPQPKRRARTSVNLEALRKAFLQSHGSLTKFMAILRSGPMMQSVTPQATRLYEQAIRVAAQGAMSKAGLSPARGPVHVDMAFIFAGNPLELPTANRDGDLDNLVKAVLDAMNGVAYSDDRLVVGTSATKACAGQDAVHVRITSSPAAFPGFAPPA